VVILFAVMVCFVWMCETMDVIVWYCETRGYVRLEWVGIL